MRIKVVHELTVTMADVYAAQPVLEAVMEYIEGVVRPMPDSDTFINVKLVEGGDAIRLIYIDREDRDLLEDLVGQEDDGIMPPIALIEIARGQVTAVQGLPKGYTWRVRDYDLCPDCGAHEPYCEACWNDLFGQKQESCTSPAAE